MIETFLHSGALRLHAIDGGGDDRVPLLIVPGLAESADDYRDLIERLAPRRCRAVTLRGRGRSDAPPEGYALEHHVADIDAAAPGDRRFCLLACSRGVAYALAYVLANPACVAGLILGDYGAAHTALAPTFADKFLTTSWRGKPAHERIAEHALRAIQHDSREASFWERLPSISCPVLVLHGAAEHGSALSAASVARYGAGLRDCRIIQFMDSGHDLRAPSPLPFYEAVEAFLRSLDELTADS